MKELFPNRSKDLAVKLVDLCNRYHLPLPIVDAKAKGLQFAAEFGRKFRFDAAWPVFRLAVEIHGGEWVGGRHATGAGLTADSVKHRHAVLLGWHILPFTGSELRESPAMVAACIRAMTEGGDAQSIQDAFDAMSAHEATRKARTNRRAKEKRLVKKLAAAAQRSTADRFSMFDKAIFGKAGDY